MTPISPRIYALYKVTKIKYDASEFARVAKIRFREIVGELVFLQNKIPFKISSLQTVILYHTQCIDLMRFHTDGSVHTV